MKKSGLLKKKMTYMIIVIRPREKIPSSQAKTPLSITCGEIAHKESKFLLLDLPNWLAMVINESLVF